MASFGVHFDSDDEFFSDCRVRGIPIIERRKNAVSRCTPNREALSSLKFKSVQTEPVGCPLLGLGSSSGS